MCLLLDHGLRVGEIAILKRNAIALRSRLLTFYRPKVDEPQTDRMTDETLAAARAIWQRCQQSRNHSLTWLLSVFKNVYERWVSWWAFKVYHRMIVGIPGRPGPPVMGHRSTD